MKKRIYFIIFILFFTLIYYFSIFSVSKSIFNKVLYNEANEKNLFYFKIYKRKIENFIYSYDFQNCTKFIDSLIEKGICKSVKIELINGISLSRGEFIVEDLKIIDKGKVSFKNFTYGGIVYSVLYYPLKDEESDFLWGNIFIVKPFNFDYTKRSWFVSFFMLLFLVITGLYILRRTNLIEDDYSILQSDIMKVISGEKRNIDISFNFKEFNIIKSGINDLIREFEDEIGEYDKLIEALQRKLDKEEKEIISTVYAVEDKKKSISKIKSESLEAEKILSFMTFISGLAHELNNPLTTIYAGLGLISSSKKSSDEIVVWADEKLKEISKIQEKIDRYGGLISQTELRNLEFVEVDRILDEIFNEEKADIECDFKTKVLLPGNYREMKLKFKLLLNYIRKTGKEIKIKLYKEEGVKAIKVSFEPEEKNNKVFIKELRMILKDFRYEIEYRDSNVDIIILAE